MQSGWEVVGKAVGSGRLKVQPFDPANPYTMRLTVPDDTVWATMQMKVGDTVMTTKTAEEVTDWAWGLLDDDRAIVYLQTESGKVLAVTSIDYHRAPDSKTLAK